MADFQRFSVGERDVDQAIIALKKGTHLLKYGRRGKPKFCPFRLSTDESALIWHHGKEERKIELRQVSRIIPGQRTAIFQRYPRPEKEYQSFSLIYNDRSLDLICKDKDEAEVWFVGLKALISRGSNQNLRQEARNEFIPSDNSHANRIHPSVSSSDQGFESLPPHRLGKAFSDIISFTAAAKNHAQSEPVTKSLGPRLSFGVDNSFGRSSAAETFRVSLSSAISSSSQGSGHDDFDASCDVLIWGEGTGHGVLGGDVHKFGSSASSKMDAFLPKALESTVVFDVHNVACGGKHAVLVTKQGDIFSWGEELGGRLGHGVEEDVSHPKLIDALIGMNIELLACGEYHTCAVTFTGDLYTWGNGSHNSSLLGHGSEVSHWIPKKVSGLMEGLHVSYISCGPWHTALVTSAGQLFTFGDGTFGALGHGDRSSTGIPREVETLNGLWTVRVACGVWHTAAIVEVATGSPSSRPDSFSSGKLFTWGDGGKGHLGHGDEETRLVPESVAALVDVSFCQVGCGHSLTIALTTSGRVYTMGSSVYGQLGSPVADGKTPTCIEGKIADCFVEEIACGSYHVAVLTSKTEVYTWGKGTNGQLGHGDKDNRNTPTLLYFLKDKQVKSVVCGANFTAAIYVRKSVFTADASVCSGCHNPFNFRRKRHNCHNCGLVFCNACSSRKSLKASLAPSMKKPYRVCDDCFNKLKKIVESGSVARFPKIVSGNMLNKFDVVPEKEIGGPWLQGQRSRLLSFSSFNEAIGRNSQARMKGESSDGRVFPIVNSNTQRGSISASKSTSSLIGGSKNFFPTFVPGSRMIYQTSSSALSSKTSSSGSSSKFATAASSMAVQTSEVILADSKHKKDGLSQEVINLRAQVEDLTSKSQLLEAELDRTSRQLKEATELAADKAEKCRAAKEVIKSLSTQLKKMAERVPGGHIANNKLDSIARHHAGDPNPTSKESNMMTVVSLKSDSNFNSSDSFLSSETKPHNEKVEWVVQDEPGVYVTLYSLPGGYNELKRVRFSRKRFTEVEAEKWWAENELKVCERHNIRIA